MTIPQVPFMQFNADNIRHLRIGLCRYHLILREGTPSQRNQVLQKLYSWLKSAPFHSRTHDIRQTILVRYGFVETLVRILNDPVFRALDSQVNSVLYLLAILTLLFYKKKELIQLLVQLDGVEPTISLITHRNKFVANQALKVYGLLIRAEVLADHRPVIGCLKDRLQEIINYGDLDPKSIDLICWVIALIVPCAVIVPCVEQGITKESLQEIIKVIENVE